jgi:peptidyl-tRNA hydrolase
VYNKKAKESSVKHWLKVMQSYDRTQTKYADLGGKGDDTSFEQSFSNLAHAYLRDSAPKLLDHEIGFQLLDRNRENTKAVGVFAFKVGSNWLYAPVFFLNGDLKGHELLYIKNQDMFVPLKENWINYLINRKPNILGSGVQRNLSGLGQRQPDFTQLSRSPAKFGSAQPTLKEMMTAAMPAFAKSATLNTAQAFKEMGDALNLKTFLKQAGREVIGTLINTCKHAPQLAAALDEFHGLDIVKQAIADAAAREVAASTKIASVLSEAPKEPASVKGLTVITYDVTIQTKAPVGHSEEDQEKLLRDGVLIQDQRDRDNVSIPYHIQVEKKLFNPTESGLYEILVKPGNIERCYVAVQPQGAAKRENFITVVRVDGARNWLNTRADQVFALARIEGEEFDKWFDSLPEANSVPSKDARYIALSKRGDTTTPFRVIKEYGDSNGSTVYEVHLEDHSKYPPKGSIGACCYTDPLNYDKWRDGVRIHLNGKKGASIRASMGDIYVPEGFKLLKVTKGEDDAETAEDQSACGCGESDPPALMPGNLADAQLALMQKTAAMIVYHNGTSVTINKEANLSPVKALVTLVEHHGLREAAAREILKQAAAKRKFAFRIKYADPYGGPMMINGAPSAPSDPGPVMGGESIMGTSVPTQLGIDVGVPVPGMSASQTDRSVYNPNTLLDQRDVRSVIDAAQSGQREVFDTAMVGAMLRAVRDDSLVDRYMGELTKGLDKLGRILFMFYWHGDRFAERYGKSDMPELEDSLRNAFEMLGDVILFLKQKTIEPYPEEAAQDVDLGAIANA